MPQSIGMNLLAKMLEEQRLSDFFLLKREYFVQDEIGIFDWIERHVNTHGVLPSLEFATARNPELEVPSSTDPYGVWHDEYTNRAIYNRFSSMLPELQRMLDHREAATALERVTAFVEECHNVRTDRQRDLVTATTVGNEVLEEYRRLRTMHGLSGVPTGWPTLDTTTHGFQRGDLVVFIARPGVGKTASMIYMAHTAHRLGFIPLFVSMEMKRVQVGGRLFALDAGLNMHSLRAGELTTAAEMRLVSSIEDFEETRPFYFLEGQFRKNVNELVSLAHSLRPDIIFVDGAYLLKLGSKQRIPKWELVTEIAEALKNLAYIRNIPVVASFQITREGGKRAASGKDMGTEYIQLSDAIGQLASVIVGVFEDESGDDPEAEYQRRMKIIKGREGERGQWWVHWNWAQMDFSEMADPLTDEEVM